MRKRTTLSEILEAGKHTQSQLSHSQSSSKFSFSSVTPQTHTRPTKGFSFGSSPRNSLLPINLTSPPPKYNIRGVVEINLARKKGPSMVSGRSDSVERTPLSYVSTNTTPGPGRYHTETSAQKKRQTSTFGKQNNENVPVEFLNEKKIKATPGPGAYKQKVVKLKGGKMSTQSRRFPDHDKENRPGPGSYESTDLDGVSRGSKVSSLTASLRR